MNKNSRQFLFFGGLDIVAIRDALFDGITA